ncbi:MAG: hypothetical protein M1816_002706 [Peltula sp. TS41687]|nr:MAG: hypothetical protein M1816_002706 [Peltula sp. TS41687]
MRSWVNTDARTRLPIVASYKAESLRPRPNPCLFLDLVPLDAQGKDKQGEPEKSCASTVSCGLRRSARIRQLSEQMIQRPAAGQEHVRPGGAVHARIDRLERTSRSVEPAAAAQEPGQGRPQTMLATEEHNPTGESSGQALPMESQSLQHLDSGEQDQVVEMRIMSQPQGALRPDVTLYPPLTVRLRSRDAGYSEATIVRDMSHLWAFLSLTDEEGIETLVPPRQGLLIGHLTNSAHALSPEDHVGLNSVGTAGMEEVTESFILFPDLVIREVGRYRLRVTLFGMQTDLEEATAGPHGASSLQEVMTDIIEIRDRPRAEASPAQENEFLSLLRRQGVAVPPPPTN